MKQKIFVLLLLFPIVAHAESLSFSVADRVYSPREEINLTFTLNSCSQEFRVRLTSDIGTVEIFNPKTLTWVSQNSCWDNFPYVEEKMKIRTVNIVDAKFLLSVELQNIKLGSLTKSKGVYLWVSDAYKNYIDTLNADIVLQTSSSADGKIQQ